MVLLCSQQPLRGRRPITLDGFAHALSQLPIPTSFDAVKNTSLMTLPLLPYPPPLPSSVYVVTNQAMVQVEFELIKPCEGEEKKTLTEKTTLAGFSKEDDARWLLGYLGSLKKNLIVKIVK
ncbi:uncharacterized protein Pyn_29338 [Prunus yedoensis var. nudiflora]|uniref:Uncharacterized protein n=1 Tax=Prunus yedoensis var. nudiflora TaxID=2094558 RepID=A0A314XLF5_PRUYE|nr:uncharacterized protein Pyn_29338 [Prunus yedoensis var. nudiflora]